MLDLVLVVVVLGFAFAGFRQGFVVSVVSFAGFVLGGLLGLWLMPALLAGQAPSGTRSLVALGGVVLLAVAGCYLCLHHLRIAARHPA